MDIIILNQHKQALFKIDYPIYLSKNEEKGSYDIKATLPSGEVILGNYGRYEDAHGIFWSICKLIMKGSKFIFNDKKTSIIPPSYLYCEMPYDTILSIREWHKGMGND